MTGGEKSFRDHSWQISYLTSAPKQDGTPTDILHDFYIPVLDKAVNYHRVAGYFRSTSLAAASQGFSAFTGNQGRVRLIVGADLDAWDVKAVLQGQGITGENPVLSDSMLKALMDYDAWPENVQCGVHLLAWMVARGLLEIRVAFRVHADTGEILTLDAVDDGYVHMKFGIFHDANQDGIYMSGSLNESKTALTLNAENIDVHCSWKGEDNALRLGDAEKRFAELWENKNPSIRVISLPDAVKNKLLALSTKRRKPREIDLTSATRVDKQPSVKELLTFAMLKDGPKLPGGRFVGMETAPITPWPHQEVVAQRLIKSWPYSYLLCDEVGLGKTIEAGLVIRSLWLSGITKRVLIASPAGLTTQWQREMAEKFFLPFAKTQGGTQRGHAYLLPRENFVKSDSLYAPQLNIVSTGLVTRKENRQDLERSKSFDIVLLDEAHYARRSNPTLEITAEPRYNRLLSILSGPVKEKAKALYLATATPMQLAPVEVYDLMGLINRVGPFQHDPALIEWYYQLVGRLVDEETLTDLEWEFLRKALDDIEYHDPFYHEFIKGSVVNTRNRLAVKRWLEHRRRPGKGDLRHLGRLIFAASPLNRVMLRHTRPLLKIYRDKGQLGAKLAERSILPVPRICLNDLEESCYKDLAVYCETLKTQILQSGGDVQKTAMGFYLMFLRLRLASSTYSIFKSLERRLDKVNETLSFFDNHQISNLEELDVEELEDESENEDDVKILQALLKNRDKKDLVWEKEYLKEMLNKMKGFSGPSSKMTCLLSVLQQRQLPRERYRQTVIFTRFFDTLEDIVKRLRNVDPRMRIGTYSGRGGQYTVTDSASLKRTSRDDIKHRFLNGLIDILVCTDAAAEGLNLQTADLLVNFDLPWNPMKVEQRIGRIDRIGQKHDRISVLNLCYLGTAEEIVYGRLLGRLAEADSVVGSQAFSMVPIEEDEFRQLEEGKIGEFELELRINQRFDQARSRTRNREVSPKDLYEIYVGMSEAFKGKTPPVTLERIWEVLSQSSYLQSLGCEVKDHPCRLFVLNNIPGIADGTLLTTSRKTFEYGLGEKGEPPEFATYGASTFDSLLKHMESFVLPDCVKRIEIDRTETSGPMVGYVLACERGDKTIGSRLVTSFDELNGLHIAEKATLYQEIDQESLESSRNKLHKIARDEFETIYIASRIEKKNGAAAASQVALNHLVVKAELQTAIKLDHGKENFGDEIKRLEQSLIEQEQRSIPNLPVASVQKLVGLLYKPVVPKVGESASIKLPVPMMMGALSQAQRTANKMHVKKSELSTAMVVTRLNNELEKILAGV